MANVIKTVRDRVILYHPIARKKTFGDGLWQRFTTWFAIGKPKNSRKNHRFIVSSFGGSILAQWSHFPQYKATSWSEGKYPKLAMIHGYETRSVPEWGVHENQGCAPLIHTESYGHFHYHAGVTLKFMQTLVHVNFNPACCDWFILHFLLHLSWFQRFIFVLQGLCRKTGCLKSHFRIDMIIKWGPWTNPKSYCRSHI